MITTSRNTYPITGRLWAFLGAAVVLASTACHDLIGNPALPVGTQDPTTYDTRDGALQRARGAITLLRQALPGDLATSGILTDELTVVLNDDATDLRSAPQADGLYGSLQNARSQARVARDALHQYAPDSTNALAEMYATEGYAEVLLADLFCSGIPLSTLDLHGDFTYHAGSSTTEVYRHAAALFDTASALAGKSVRVMTFARVGWGRALSALGQLDSAAHVVASVPDTATYGVRIKISGTGFGGNTRVLFGTAVSVSDREGHNGLNYWSSGDPRTVMDSTLYIQSSTQSRMVYYPTKYADAVIGDDSTKIVLASGIEARLIEAEAEAVRGGTRWLSILNALRTNFSDVGSLPALADSSAGLPDATALEVRVNLVFRERAFWLYLTGHRQGDLRRLVRSPIAGGYGRRETAVYPTGIAPEGGQYGHALTIPVPSQEHALNPHYKGCENDAA